MKANSCLQIDLSAVRDNVLQIRKEIGPGVKLIPVLKGNAYGLGACKLADILGDIDGIDIFAVSHVAEGIELRKAGIRQRILVLSLPLDFQLEEAVACDLTLTLGSFRQFPLFRELARRRNSPVAVSLKLDTGLHRIGFTPEEMEALCAELKAAGEYLTIVDTFSHFAENSEEEDEEQAECFRHCINRLREAGIDPGLCHISSSASLEAGKDNLFDAVRVGRRLFLDRPGMPTGKIREAVSFRAYVADVRERNKGESRAYGGKLKLKKKTRVGVLSIGYGDGLDPALASVQAPVLVNGQRAKLLACCMDQSFLDLGEIPCEAGDEVTLFGNDGNGVILPAQEVMSLIGCEGVDQTARLTDRVDRVYVGE